MENLKNLENKIKLEVEKKGFYISKFENFFKSKNYFNKKIFLLGILFQIVFIISGIYIGIESSISLFIIIFYIIIFLEFKLKNNKNKDFFEYISLNEDKNIEKDKKYFFFKNIKISLIIGAFILIANLVLFLIFYLPIFWNNFINQNYKFIFFINTIISSYIVYNILKNEDLNNYILITENNVFMGGKEYKIIIGSINTNKNVKTFFEKNFFPSSYTGNNISKFKQKLIDLNFFSKEIEKTKNNFSKNIENLEFHKIKNEINFLGKNINKSYKIKEKIKNDLISKKYFPEEKFENYLKENILFPLKEIKKILENNLNYVENLQNKNSENPQIILANKRLEIQKNSLQKQILLLDEKIKKLEN